MFEEIYLTLKSFLDPLFIVFILLVMAFVFLWRAASKKTGALVLLLAIVFLYAASIAPVANYLCHGLEKDYIGKKISEDENLDVIVVLGGGSYDIHYANYTYPSASTVVRLLYAVDYYRKNPSKYFLCSGKGPGRISEAEMMAHLAASLGVPKEKIKVDARSANTWQSAAETHKIFPQKETRIALVTSAFHMKRSEREFKKYFEHVLPLPGGYLYSSSMGPVLVRYIPQTNELHKTQNAFVEMIANISYLAQATLRDMVND